MALTMFGIRNCDTVKKARVWLDATGIGYDFHDYKVSGVDAAQIAAWIEALGWESVLNQAGTTFRKLPDAEKTDLDATRAAALMLAHPSMIKRPMLEGSFNGTSVLLTGFKPEVYAARFG